MRHTLGDSPCDLININAVCRLTDRGPQTRGRFPCRGSQRSPSTPHIYASFQVQMTLSQTLFAGRDAGEPHRDEEP